MKHVASPLDLESLEVYLHPLSVSQEEWNPLYEKMKSYLENFDDSCIMSGHYPATLDKRITPHHIHINVRRAFTTDAVLLYKDLSSYINQQNPLILLGVMNQHGKISTPFIMDLLVILNAHFPKLTTIEGFLHPACWKEAIYRVREYGYFS